MADELDIEVIINDSQVGPKQILKEQLKGYDDEAVSNLAIDLYDYLSKDKLDESKDLINQFYEEYYHTSFDEETLSEELEHEQIDEEVLE